MKKASAQQALHRAKALQKAGDVAGAKAALEDFLQRFPKNTRVRNALDALGARPAAPPPELLENLRAAAQQGHLAQAAARAAQLTRDYPNSAELWDITGVLHSTLGKLDLAEAAFGKVVALTPKSPDAHYKLGALFLARKQHGKAVLSLREAVALRAGFALAQIALGTALLGLEEYEEAERWLRTGLETRPEDAQAHNTHGIALLELSRPLEAVSAFETALALNRSNAKYWANLGGACSKCGWPEKALECFEKAVELWPVSAAALVSLSSVKFELDQIPEAVSDSLKALELDPPNEKAALQLATAPTGSIPAETAHMLRNFASISDTNADAARLALIRAGALRHLGDLEESFRAHCAANDLLNDPAAVAVWRESCLRTSKEVANWTPNTGASEADTAYRLLFILGPSRSGKTTVEKLLSNSPWVLPVREAWQGDQARQYLRGRVRHDETAAGDVSRVFYVCEAELASQGIRLVTSTNPFILDVAHLIHDAFQNALFLFVERDEIRTASEIFTRGYKSELPFAQSAAESLDYVRWYRETGRALAEKMGPRARSVDYKDLAGGHAEFASELESFVGVLLFDSLPKPLIAPREDVSPYARFFGALVDQDKTSQ